MTRILHGGMVFPVAGPAVADGAVAVRGGLIAGCGGFAEVRGEFPEAAVVDLTDGAILPGLINAHVHLELSGLKGKVPYRGSFTDWLLRVAAARPKATADLEGTIAAACRESLRAGVTTVYDICAGHRAWPYLAREPIRKVCFAEVISIRRTRRQCADYLRDCVSRTRTDELLRLGLSPHAPYSTSREVYELAARLAAEHDLPLTTHLAETPGELQLFRGRAGLRRYLGRVCGGGAERKGGGDESVVRHFLGYESAGRRYLLAHVNYADDADLEALARSGHSVVYCPRSHAFFGHRGHRFREMSARGINVCLGTDSLASNTSLSILDEMRFIHEHYRDFPVERILEMATINAAGALGMDRQTGTIERGKAADLTVVACARAAEGTSRLSLEDVIEGTGQVRGVMVEGRFVWPGQQEDDGLLS